MIIQQLVRIGALVDTDYYSALIEQSYKGRIKLLAVLDCNIWDNDSPLVPKSYEFKDEEKALYALGYAPGNSLPSICHPIDFRKWEAARDDENQSMNLKKKSQLGRIVTRTRGTNDVLVSQLNQWLSHNLERIYDVVSEYLFISNEFTSNTAPKWLILRILDAPEDGAYRWPGELEQLRQLFVNSFTSSSIVEDSGVVCHGCGKRRNSVSSFAAAKMFTLDQVGYSIGFNPNNSTQFPLCEECTTQATVGLNIIESEMTFYAYSVRRGRGTTPVRYQIIPNTENKTSLEQCVRALINVSRRGQARAVQSIKDALEKVERRRENVDLAEALSVLPHRLSYTVAFYYESAQSRMKNMVGSYFFPGTRLREITSILEDISRGFGLSRMTEIKTQRLFHIMGPKVLPAFLGALFLGTRVDRRLLLRAGATYRPDDREDTIRHMFLDMIREKDGKRKLQTQRFVGRRVRDLLTLYDTLYNHDLLGGKK